MKIVLLGYMASGKSSVGKKLANSLGIKFIDLDDYIIAQEKMSIKEIFKNKGEVHFRLLEHKYLKEVLEKSENFILSLGGGTPCYANNMSEINSESIISIYLQGTITTLVDRLIKNKEERPLIATLPNDKIQEFVAKHLFERRFFYEQAKIKVKIDDKSITELVTEIEKLLH